MKINSYFKWVLKFLGIFFGIVIATLLIKETGTNLYLLYGAYLTALVVLVLTIYTAVKYFKGKAGKKVQFFNNDMDKIVWDSHNKMHFVFVLVLTAMNVIPVWIGICIMAVWEIGDGFKPWYYDFKPVGHPVRDWFRREFLYSNKFSFQDFFVWNIMGFGWGIILRNLFVLLIK